MKNYLLLLIIVVGVLSCASNKKNNEIPNPLMCDGTPILLGDPFMYKHNGTYYLTGTGPASKGFPCYISEDMINWKYNGLLWQKGDSCWASDMFWAPEIKFYQNKFYLTYSGLRKETNNQLRIALAVSDTPEGPYTDLHGPWFDYGFGAIDGHILVDGDQPYLYFSMNGGKDGYSFGITYGVQLEKDLSAPVGDTVKLIEASQDWERVNWDKNRCNEGPFVFKYKDTYYMTYSGNHTFEPNYGIGYATAPSPLGPWTKAEENPIASRDTILNLTGIGHNSLLPTDKEDELLIIYHTHADPSHPENQQRHANIGLIKIDKSGKLVFQPQVK